MIPEDLKKLLPPRPHTEEAYNGPLYWIWTFDPHDDKVHMIHNDNTHPAFHQTHQDLHTDVPDPERVDGYAYKIRGGFRITDSDHRPLDDPHITHKVLTLLRGAQPKKPLPHIPYHHDTIHTV